MIEELRIDFQLTAEQFSTLGAFYLYTYSLLQIPIGILFDRIGVRKMMLASIVLCVAGNFLFGLAEVFWVAQLSRILIGAGSACAFSGAVKLAADHFEPGKRGFFIGLTLTIGMLGPVLAGKPLVGLVETLHWRSTMLILSCLGIVIAIIAYSFIPKYVKDIQQSSRFSWKSFLKDTWSVISQRTVILYALLAIGLFAPLAVLADFWGTAFFMQKFSFAKSQAAFMAMFIYVGLAVGALVLPGYCEKKNLISTGIKICSLGILILFTTLLYGPQMSTLGLYALLFFIGFFCGSEMMCFTGAVAGATPHTTGLIIGVVNTTNMLGGGILQRWIGKALDAEWKGALTADGLRFYSTAEYVHAMNVLIYVIGFTVILSIFLKRSKTTE